MGWFISRRLEQEGEQQDSGRTFIKRKKSMEDNVAGTWLGMPIKPCTPPRSRIINNTPVVTVVRHSRWRHRFAARGSICRVQLDKTQMSHTGGKFIVQTCIPPGRGRRTNEANKQNGMQLTSCLVLSALGVIIYKVLERNPAVSCRSVFPPEVCKNRSSITHQSQESSECRVCDLRQMSLHL